MSFPHIAICTQVYSYLYLFILVFYIYIYIYVYFLFCLFPQEKPKRETEMAKLTESMSEYK